MQMTGSLARQEESQWQSHVLTDGWLDCSYRELGGLLTHIAHFFQKQSITQETAFIFECDNSLHSAVTLLYLLENGYSFLLFPKGRELNPAYKTSPLFYFHVLVTQDEGAEVMPLVEPDRYLQVIAHPVTREHLPTQGGKLFLQTSGSTGVPKLVRHSHEKLRENARHCVNRLRLTSQDRVAIPVPIFHMYGLGAAFLPSILVGASLDLQRGANLLKYLKREREFNPNIAFLTPVFADTLVRGRRSVRPYRFSVMAGDRLREGVFAQYEAKFGCLIQLYGSTEMGAIAATSPEDSAYDRENTAGYPMPDVSLRQEQEENPAGIHGDHAAKLFCQRDCGFENYIDVNHGEVVLDDGTDLSAPSAWFYTKDLGILHDDGRLTVLGRADHSVNRDGLLVFFAEVEKALDKIACVESSVIISEGEGQRGKAIIAYIVPNASTSCQPEQIRAACFDHLPIRAIPDEFILVESLPLLPNGKVDREKIRLAYRLRET